VIYLASPYSHVDPAVRQWRFDAACRATAVMLRAGMDVFSPIVHSHPVAAWGLDAMDHRFWMRVDRPYLDWCESVAVLTLPGWRESKGIAAELDIARAADKLVFHVEPWVVGIDVKEAAACC